MSDAKPDPDPISDETRKSYPYRFGALACVARLFLLTGSARELAELRRQVNEAHTDIPSAMPVTEEDCARLAERILADQRREKDAARIFARIDSDRGAL